jgi:hypothetical protein
MKKLICLFFLMVSVATPSFADNEFMSQTAVSISNSSMLQTVENSNSGNYIQVEKKKSAEQLAQEKHNHEYGHDSGSSGGVLILFAVLMVCWLFNPKKQY